VLFCVRSYIGFKYNNFVPCTNHATVIYASLDLNISTFNLSISVEDSPFPTIDFLSCRRLLGFLDRYWIRPSSRGLRPLISPVLMQLVCSIVSAWGRPRQCLRTPKRTKNLQNLNLNLKLIYNINASFTFPGYAIQSFTVWISIQ